MEFRISEVVLSAMLKINRKPFLNEIEIIWKAMCFKACLLYCQLECVHIFSYLSFSVCISLSLFGGKMLERWRFEKSVVVDLVGYGGSERADCRLLPTGW